MKVKYSNNRRSLVIWSLILVFIAGVTTYVIYNFQNKTETTINKNEKASKQDITTKAEDETKGQIKLPGADSVERIEGDPRDDDHLWRMVNKSNPLNNLHYRPASLSIIADSRTDKSKDERSIRTDIIPAVQELFLAAKRSGFELINGSSFRDYDLQKFYYTNYVKNFGQEAADTFSAKPGYSEHQTGLTMDLVAADGRCYLEECFGGTEAGKWLAENAYKYGFILRYPKDKAGITDFIYEPWHFRYVGKDLARALTQSGLTLEEAWKYLIPSES